MEKVNTITEKYSEKISGEFAARVIGIVEALTDFHHLAFKDNERSEKEKSIELILYEMVNAANEKSNNEYEEEIAAYLVEHYKIVLEVSLLKAEYMKAKAEHDMGVTSNKDKLDDINLLKEYEKLSKESLSKFKEFIN